MRDYNQDGDSEHSKPQLIEECDGRVAIAPTRPEKNKSSTKTRYSLTTADALMEAISQVYPW